MDGGVVNDRLWIVLTNDASASLKCFETLARIQNIKSSQASLRTYQIDYLMKKAIIFST
jgi:hypothetical protein